MSKYSLTWMAIFIAIVLMFMRLPQMVAKQDNVLHTYSALVEVDALAKQQFVETIEGNRLVHGAIRGMMFQLDPYSAYIAPDQLAAFKRRNLGNFIGIGIELGMHDNQLLVVAPIEGSPAAAAGMVAGDLILSIDGKAVEGFSVFDVEELLGGERGSTVSLRVRHPGASRSEVLTIVRGPVSLVTVRGFRRSASGHWEHMIDSSAGIGYVRISNFLDNTMSDFDRAFAALERHGVRALILDLRFNPGGLMRQGIELVDRFVDDGVIVSTVTRRRAIREYQATLGGAPKALKLVVLINAGSASASEIVAGSLQAHHRATLIGERSFGKGSVQKLIPLTEQRAAVKLTTAYYRLPDGRLIHRTNKNAKTNEWGVTPDVEVSLTDEEVHAIQDSRRAIDLAFGDAGTSLGNSRTSNSRSGVEVAVPQNEILRDRQLLEALRFLSRQVEHARKGLEHRDGR